MNIPELLRQNETVSWTDDAATDEVTGASYTSDGYDLSYILAGPIAAPVTLTADPSGQGWITELDAVNSALLAAGLYRWQAVVTATDFRRVIGQGELRVEPDLSTVTGTFDPRSDTRKSLEQWEAALAAVSTDRVREYQIGNRRLSYRDLKDIISMVEFLTARLVTEQSQQGGAKDRHLLVRFERAH